MKQMEANNRGSKAFTRAVQKALAAMQKSPLVSVLTEHFAIARTDVNRIIFWRNPVPVKRATYFHFFRREISRIEAQVRFEIGEVSRRSPQIC